MSAIAAAAHEAFLAAEAEYNRVRDLQMDRAYATIEEGDQARIAAYDALVAAENAMKAAVDAADAERSAEFRAEYGTDIF